jgi:hypothetical protein
LFNGAHGVHQEVIVIIPHLQHLLLGPGEIHYLLLLFLNIIISVRVYLLQLLLLSRTLVPVDQAVVVTVGIFFPAALKSIEAHRRRPSLVSLLFLFGSDWVRLVQEVIAIPHNAWNVVGAPHFGVYNYLPIMFHFLIEEVNFSFPMIVDGLINPLVVESVHLRFNLKLEVSVLREE